jgi:hypothetical protein
MQASVMVLALAALAATSAAAQRGEKPVAPRAGVQAPAPAAEIAMSQSPNPTGDEGTIQRISSAMLSYTVLEVQGGWPMLPPKTKLAPGSKGGDADTRPQVASAARASGFVLQSADTPHDYKQVSYRDSQ